MGVFGKNLNSGTKNSLKHVFAGGTGKYKSSGSHISVNTRANNTRETQELTSGFKQSSFKVFSTGVHPNFLLEISPILNFCA